MKLWAVVRGSRLVYYDARPIIEATRKAARWWIDEETKPWDLRGGRIVRIEVRVPPTTRRAKRRAKK